MRVHFNGVLMAVEEARIDPSDRGFTLGDGLYETIAVRGGRVRRLGAHMSRLQAGAEILGLPLAASPDTLAARLIETMEANGITDGALRLTLTRGPSPRGLPPPPSPTPTILITAHAGDLPSPSVTAIIASGPRRNELSPLSRCKHLGDLDALIARMEAEGRGAGEALLLNSVGRLAEASTANLFAVVDGGLVTPSLDEGPLPGVMRAAIMDGLGAEERPLGPRDLMGATEAFLTNSLGVRALVSVDGRSIGDGQEGPVTAQARRLAAD